MTIKPNRHWFQFRLSTLLLVITVFAMLLSRIAYLQQRARYHELEADRCAERFARYGRVTRAQVDELADMLRSDSLVYQFRDFPMSELPYGSYPPELRPIFYHQDLAEKYRQVVWRPWTIVKVPPPPLDPLSPRPGNRVD